MKLMQMSRLFHVLKLARLFSLFGIIILSSTCSKHEHLSKISFEEELELKINNRFSLANTFFYDQDGKEIKNVHLDSIKNGLVGFDHYTNESNSIMRTAIRKRHFTDNLMMAVMSKYDSSFFHLDTYNIDCEQLEVEIDFQFDIIPGFRFDTLEITEYNCYDVRSDRYLSILNKCKYADVAEMDDKHKNKFWLEYQHAGAEVMATYYYPLLHELFKDKELNAECYALSIDRILMNGNYPQIYGSQLMNSQLWPIADTTKLDSIRLSMGMQTLKEYLEYF